MKILGTLHEYISTCILFDIELGKKSSVKFRNFRSVSLSHERRLLASSCLSVCLSLSACITAAPTGGIFVKLHIGAFFLNL